MTNHATVRAALYQWLDIIADAESEPSDSAEYLPGTESELTAWIDALVDVDSDFHDSLREAITAKYGDLSGPIMWTRALYNTRRATVTRRAIGDLTTAIAAAADLIGQASVHLDELTGGLDEALSSAPYCVAAGDLTHFLNEARRALVAAGSINRNAQTTA